MIKIKRQSKGDWQGTNINFYVDDKLVKTFNTLSDDYAETNASAFLRELKQQNPTMEIEKYV